MQIEKFTKQSYEQFYIAGNFSLNLGDGETIDDETVTAVDKTGADATATVLTAGTDTIVDGKVRVQVTGGSQALSPYRIRFIIETSLTNKWEIDVKMRVKEI
jgi:hypothetical protein